MADNALQDAIYKLLALKRENPYIRDKWRSSSDLANQCLSLLETVKQLLDDLIVKNDFESRVELTTKISKGVGYFPRAPWISFLPKGETTSSGIYVVISFDACGEGFFVGCADSYLDPQPGFHKFCYTRQELDSRSGRRECKQPPYSAHLAKGAVWFSYDEQFLEQKLVDSLRLSFQTCKRARDERDVRSDWYDQVPIGNIFAWLLFVSSHMTVANNDGSCWVFRGQGNAKWQLSSSLERTMEGSYDLLSTCRKQESKAINHFKQISASKLGYREVKDVDALALIQHYGGKTRLLDFTRSPLIALYMALEQHALEKEKPEFSVWAVNLKPLIKGSTLDAYNQDMRDKMNASFKEFIVNCKDQKVCAIFPEVLNRRMAAQEGLFVMSTDLQYSLSDSLREMCIGCTNEWRPLDILDKIEGLPSRDYIKPFVYKFVFSADMVRQAREMLENLAITPKVVYPDLMGMAKDTVRFFA